MIAFSSMLVGPASKAGIKVPKNVEDYSPEEFVHWHIYQAIQLCAAMPSPNAHWENAQLIASYTEEQAKIVTYQQLLDDGLSVGSSSMYY